jgi:hypothetical protein
MAGAALTAWTTSACLACGACGRIGFGATTGADERPVDAVVDTAVDAVADAPPARIAYVAPFFAADGGTGRQHSFTAQARAAGDAIVIQVACSGTARPSGVALTASGWSFVPLGGVTESSSSNENAAAFFAIAPDAVGATFTVTWSGSQCNNSTNDVGDEFTLDPPGGTIVVGGFASAEGLGDCVGTVATARAGEAVWSSCDSERNLVGRGPGFAAGADDGVGDWSEYKLTTDPAGTVERVLFTNETAGYVLSIVTLAPG